MDNGRHESVKEQLTETEKEIEKILAENHGKIMDASKEVSDRSKAVADGLEDVIKPKVYITPDNNKPVIFEIKRTPVIPKIDMSDIEKEPLRAPIDNIMIHIRKAKIEAERNNIKANMIIIDEHIAKVNNLYSWDGRYVRETPPMIFGLQVEYLEDLSKDYGANFIITKGNTVADENKKLREENARLKERLRKIEEALGYGLSL